MIIYIFKSIFFFNLIIMKLKIFNYNVFIGEFTSYLYKNKQKNIYLHNCIKNIKRIEEQIKIIKFYDADIVCLQEVYHHKNEYILYIEDNNYLIST